MTLQPLARLRLGLTAWYLATFGAILVFLGGGLFVVPGFYGQDGHGQQAVP